MPTIHHDGPIDVIRSHPDMTADLVRLVTPIEIPSQDRLRVELGANDASNVVPDEFRADMVTVIRARETGEPLLLVVIESQGRWDDEKDFAWPAYLTNLRAAHKCKAAVLIVICWDAAEAEKCRQAIRLGHPNFVLFPIVIGPRDGHSLDNGGPWLTVLAASMGAIDMETAGGSKSVYDAIPATGADITVQRNLLAIILGVASDAARAKLEALMQVKQYPNAFLDGIEARAEERGEARGEAKALLKVLGSRGVELTSEQQEQIMSCTDPEQLDRWLDRAGSAISADDVFKD